MYCIKHSRKTFYSILFSTMLFFILSCDQGSKVRKYKAKIPAAPSQETEPIPQGYSWQIPEDWVNVPSSSSMRLASFSIKSGKKESLCTIVPLKGDAGGLQANISRWLGQIPTEENNRSRNLKVIMDSLEKLTTSGGFSALLIDFTKVTKNATDKSIIVTIVKNNDDSLFVKMSGEKIQLQENKPKFIYLCRSLALKKTIKK